MSWRKERIEQIVTNKLRSVLLRLTFDNQLEEEICKYHNDVNKHVLLECSNLESEVAYLTRRISQLEDELKAGSGKSYYADMLQDLQNDLAAKQDELNNVKMSYRELELLLLQSITNDIRVMIGMLDDEMQNPQLMNDYIRKFVSRINVHREMKRVHITVQLGNREQILYQKMVVVDWE
ncbi:hypothetical protein ACFRAM_28440 [Paenibacillus sp. NPDC056722]|uniref:hypothetical protein n=1 Tax=Paenibacillus sp. NPDC056722 TaxID=3345924 RepID=UPI00368F7626